MVDGWSKTAYLTDQIVDCQISNVKYQIGGQISNSSNVKYLENFSAHVSSCESRTLPVQTNKVGQKADLPYYVKYFFVVLK